ncbi:MAG: efflux RND transporter permease subunit [Chlamydiia bacterium]
MNIAKPFIQRPVATLLVMVTFVVFGLFSYDHLPVSTIPTVQFPTIQVTVNYPGASPKEMTVLVCAPLERQFMMMQGIRMVTSQNTYQSTTIILQFHEDVDINVAATNTQQAISQAQGQLPNNLPQPPAYTKVNPADTPVMYVVIYSDTQPQGVVYDYGYNYVSRQLGAIEGVANIQVFGQPYAVRVHVDPEAVAAKGLTLDDVSNAIQMNNPIQPTGKFYGPDWAVITETDGQLYKAETYNSMIIKIKDDNIVRLRDIGCAYDSVQNDKETFKWLIKDDPNDKEATILAIFKQANYNTVEVCTNLEKMLDQLKVNLPQSIQTEIAYSQRGYILDAIEDVQVTLFIAFALVVIVIFLYLGKVRNSLIPLITLPITVLGTFMLMYPLNYSVDIMSMSALTLAIGFLIDDAIIVLENIVRYSEEGIEPYKAALKGSNQIIITVLSISLCLCAVFIPMLFIPGFVGQLFHEFAAVMIVSVIFSGFISLSLTPVLCSRFIPPYNPNDQTKVEKMSIRFNEWLRKKYDPLLKWSLNHRMMVLVIAALTCYGSLHFAYKMPKEFLPPMDIGTIMGFVIAQEGSSPEKTQKYLDIVGEICHQNPYVSHLCVINGYPTDCEGLIFANLVEDKDRPPTEVVMRQLYEAAQNVIGCAVFFKPYPLINLQIGTTDSGRADNQFVIQSSDEDILSLKTQEMVVALRQLPQFSQVNTNLQPNSPILNVHILRDEARAFGDITPLEVENTFKYAYGETYISKINNPEDLYYVILEVKNRYKRYPTNLDALYLGPDGGQTSITSVTNTAYKPSPIMVNNVNSIGAATISFNVAPGYALSDAVTVLNHTAERVLEGKAFGFLAGNTAEFASAMKQFALLILLALFVIYIILGILYENFIHPIVPLSAVPLAVFGGLISLVIMGEALSIYALIGIIMLMGIVMKNGILIVDFALEEIKKDPNCSPADAITKASMIRFRPILMTTFAAMMGAIPVALGIGGEIARGRAPLGIAVVGGLIFAQIVSLVVVPVVFTFVYNWSNHLTSKKEGLFVPHEMADLDDQEKKEDR